MIRGWLRVLGVAGGRLGRTSVFPGRLSQSPDLRRRWRGRAPARFGVALGVALTLAAPAGTAATGSVRSGTAFFVSPSGYLLTSAHVVTGCKGVPIWPAEGDQMYARVVAAAADPDIALLSVADKAGQFASAASLDPPKEGAALATVGFGVLRHWPRLPVLSRGRFLGYADTPEGRQVLVMDSSELPEGNSGGPVIDARGSLVGMVIGRFAKTPVRGVVVSAADLARFLARNGVGGLTMAPAPRTSPGAANVLYGMSALVQCAGG